MVMMMVVWWLFLLAIGVGVVALIEVSVFACWKWYCGSCWLEGIGTVIFVGLRALRLWYR